MEARQKHFILSDRSALIAGIIFSAAFTTLIGLIL
jgi:hypothetical protein